MRADAAAPAAPVGAHARARARNHEHRREPLYIDTPCSGNLIDIPCCRGWTSTLRRGLGGATSEKQLRRRPTGLGPQDAGCQQVCSHRPSDLILPAHVCWWTPQPRSVDSTESTRIARAGVYRSARLWARWNRAALLPRVVPLKLGYRARKRVVWSSGHKRLRFGCPRPLLALRSLWGGLGTVPGPSLGGRRPQWRSAAPGEAVFARTTFPRLPPLGCKSQKFGLEGWGDPNKAKLAGNKKIEVMWYMGLKKGPLQGLCLVFCVIWTARGFSGDVGSLLPP